DDAVVGDIGRVAQDAHLRLDVGVIGLDGLATVGAGRATERHGHVDVTKVDGQSGGGVRAREDACHLGVGVDAVLVEQGDVGELVARGRAGVDPGDGLAAQLLELGDAAVTTDVELRAVSGAAAAYRGDDDSGAVGVDSLDQRCRTEQADIDAAGTDGFDQANEVGADEGLYRDQQAFAEHVGDGLEAVDDGVCLAARHHTQNQSVRDVAILGEADEERAGQYDSYECGD